MKNKKNNEKATAPKEATVAKTAKEAAIDPEIGDEIIGMDIKLFDSNTDEVVKNDELKKEFRLILSRELHYVIKENVMVNSKDDAKEFNKLIVISAKSAARHLFCCIGYIAETCHFLYLKASITLDESVNGIKQIIIEHQRDFSIITENCYAHLDENTDLITDKIEYIARDGKFINVGNKLLRSVDFCQYFNIYYDSIDINRDAKRLVEWIKEM